MPVYKNKDRGWYARVNYVNELGEYRQKNSKYFNTKKEAQEEEIRLSYQLSLTRETSSSNITFKEAYEEMSFYNKDKVKYSTYRNYPALWAHCKSLANIRIKDLTVPKYNAFKEELNATELTTTRKNAIHKFIKQIINYANKMYDINCTVPLRVGGFKDADKIRTYNVDFFTYEEFSKFIKEVETLRYKAIFMALYYQGLRIGEANALNWNDIDFENHKMTINKNCNTKITGIEYMITSTKRTSSDRVLPIEKETEDILKELKKEQQTYSNYSDEWFVFGGASPLKMTSLTNVKNESCKKAGVKQIRIHDFRHSCASFLINLGCQPNVVQKYLGHASLKITLDTYSHLYPNTLNETIIKINEFKNKADS